MMVNSKWMRMAYRLSSLAITNTLILYGSFQLGTNLDKSWKTTPCMLLLCLDVGANYGLWGHITTLNRMKF